MEFADLFPAPRVLAMISSRRRLRASRSSSSFFNFSSNSACLRSASSLALRSASLRLASSSSWKNVCKKLSYVNLICFFRENGYYYLFTFFFRSSSSRFWASSMAFCNLCSSARRASAANLSASSIALRSSSSSLAFIKSKKKCKYFVRKTSFLKVFFWRTNKYM